MPAETAAALVEPEAPPRGTSPLIGIILAIAVLGAGAYWTFMRPSPPTDRVTGRPIAGAVTPAAAPAPNAASPEARAWDAAAHAKELPPPTSNATPDAPKPPTPPGSIEEMVDRVMPAVVLIETSAGRGSGFFVSHDTLITNVHVVQNDAYVTLRKMDGSTVNARVQSKAPAYDIAVLKVASPSPTQAVIPMATAQSLKPGQEIVVIGSALGTLQNSVSRGIVSGLRSAGGATLVQTDAAVNPGNSGGPMLDRDGAVIGITTMGYKNAEGLNFGVAIDHARDLLDGRMGNLGTQSGLQDIQAQSRGSETDRRHQQGEEQFRGAVGQLATPALDIDSGWARFRSQCFKTPISGNYDREWFAVMVPHSLPADAAAGCTNYYNQLESAIKEFHTAMQHVLADARRSDVLPGTVRDTLREKKLDFDWDR